jgi:hypothetical protein
MLKRLIEYFKSLTYGTSKESSKRFIALYVGVVLISYIVFVFTRPSNVEMVLGELVAFVCVLLGVAAWERRGVSSRNKKDKKDESE